MASLNTSSARCSRPRTTGPQPINRPASAISLPPQLETDGAYRESMPGRRRAQAAPARGHVGLERGAVLDAPGAHPNLLRLRSTEPGRGSHGVEARGDLFRKLQLRLGRPCTVTSFASPATGDRCQVILNYHVRRGEVDGVDVSGKPLHHTSRPHVRQDSERNDLFYVNAIEAIGHRCARSLASEPAPQ